MKMVFLSFASESQSLVARRNKFSSLSLERKEALTDRSKLLQMSGCDPPSVASRAGLEHLSQLLEETEHFRGWRQEKVAKIVQRGETI